MSESGVRALTVELIRCASVTPDDAGCQTLIAQRLQAAGFAVEHHRFGAVDNLWATHVSPSGGATGPTLCFLGHTDVVPSGPEPDWQSAPFTPSEREGRLYGRGAADMKGSVAAFVVALESLVHRYPKHPGRLALLLTSDEEGDAVDGVRRMAGLFQARGERIDYCLVGEPSSAQRLGDTVRIGRRGSLTANIEVIGKQGHVAYPHLADNPIHRALPALQELVARRWDPEPYPEFPPSSLQIANLQSGTGASNVIPGTAQVQINLRYSPHWTAATLISEIESCLARHDVPVRISWHRSGEPFYTAEGPLRAAVRDTVTALCGGQPDENTGGGTSDGRFLAPLGAEVVELGPLNASIHQVDEWIDLADLDRLPQLYASIAERVLKLG